MYYKVLLTYLDKEESQDFSTYQGASDFARIMQNSANLTAIAILECRVVSFQTF